jgi:hypothetical protein
MPALAVAQAAAMRVASDGRPLQAQHLTPAVGVHRNRCYQATDTILAAARTFT